MCISTLSVTSTEKYNALQLEQHAQQQSVWESEVSFHKTYTSMVLYTITPFTLIH